MILTTPEEIGILRDTGSLMQRAIQNLWTLVILPIMLTNGDMKLTGRIDLPAFSNGNRPSIFL